MGLERALRIGVTDRVLRRVQGRVWAEMADL